MMNIPNALTLARMFLIVPIGFCFYLEGDLGPLAVWIAFLLYVIASLTDFFDGMIARKLNQITAFGTFLDPISDKIFVAALMVLLVGFGRLEGLWMIPVIVIFTREFLISGLREFLGPHNVKMPVTKLAKWKTASQMVALGFLILGNAAPYDMQAGQALLLVAMTLTVITGWGYMKTGLSFMRESQ
jgi:CDP-diacylglycerol--glycerol-3-phosphate 3-phosphatidyltransferase